MGAKYFGAAVRRLEDPRFLRGEGRFVDDVTLPGVLHAAFLRSPHAHATLVNIRTDAAGAFQIPVLVLYHDLLGPRMLRAIVPNDQGDGAGVAIEADAPFLVTPGRSQPSDFSLRR